MKHRVQLNLELDLESDREFGDDDVILGVEQILAGELLNRGSVPLYALRITSVAAEIDR